MLAADVRSGQAELVAEIVGEQTPRIGGRLTFDAVDLHAANAFSVRTRTRCIRNSGVASRSPLGCSSATRSRGSASAGVGATPNRASLGPARTPPPDAKPPCPAASAR